jgi:hypothetical protein
MGCEMLKIIKIKFNYGDLCFNANNVQPEPEPTKTGQLHFRFKVYDVSGKLLFITDCVYRFETPLLNPFVDNETCDIYIPLNGDCESDCNRLKKLAIDCPVWTNINI